jgi:hypothetical protein
MAAFCDSKDCPMARKIAAPRAVAVPSPVPALLERVAKLTGAGAAPERLVRETEAVIAEWKGAGLPASDLTERMEVLRDDLEGGLEAAIEQAGDVSRDDKAGMRGATRVVDGLRGTLDAVRAAMDGL